MYMDYFDLYAKFFINLLFLLLSKTNIIKSLTISPSTSMPQKGRWRLVLSYRLLDVLGGSSLPYPSRPGTGLDQAGCGAEASKGGYE